MDSASSACCLNKRRKFSMRVYYDRDADVGLVKKKKVVIVGYGSQGLSLIHI